jgi:hypothetical protein
MTHVDPVKEHLIESDDSYRRLYQEHLEYKERLSAIRQKSLMSQEDEIEMKRIKLHKLSLKDQMEAIRRRHLLEHASA